MRVASVLVALALLSGCAAGRTNTGGAVADSPPSSTGLSAPVSAGGPGSSDADDARLAALRYVASTDTLMAHSPIGRAEIFRSLVTPSAVREQVAAFEVAAEQLAVTLDVPVERLVWVEAPVTATLVDADESLAAVDVWTVSILGAPGSGSPQQVWRTVHVEPRTARRSVARGNSDGGRRSDAGRQRTGAAVRMGRVRPSRPVGPDRRWSRAVIAEGLSG